MKRSYILFLLTSETAFPLTNHSSYCDPATQMRLFLQLLQLCWQFIIYTPDSCQEPAVRPFAQRVYDVIKYTQRRGTTPTLRTRCGLLRESRVPSAEQAQICPMPHRPPSDTHQVTTTHTHLLVYLGPAFYFSYYHAHDGTPVGRSEREEPLVGGDIAIP